MKVKHIGFNLVFFCSFIIFGCNNDGKGNDVKTTVKDTKADNQASVNNNTDLQAPDFSDPVLKKYFSDYTNYMKKLVASIRNKDESGTMKLFTEEGKQFNNKNEMEEKAKSQEEQTFTTWLMQSVPLQSEIVRSEYFKKFNEAHYEKVREKMKAMDKK